MKTRRGVVMINTGKGKGKTTAALGAVLRAAGRGLSVFVLQFIKREGDYGELKGLASLPGVKVMSMGLGLIGESDPAPHRDEARRAWAVADQEVRAGRWDLVVLDELCIALHYGFISIQEVADLIQSKPEELILIITGRHCPEELFPHADTVTVMEMVKHHMQSGLESQAGVEY